MNKPSWFSSQHAGKWDRVKEAIHRDWDQTKHDLHMGGHELNQKLSDTVGQVSGREAVPPIDEANPPKVIGRWEDAEAPLGFGYAAREQFGKQYPEWNTDLDRKLESDWKAEPPWLSVRHLVRRGYEIKR